MAREIYHNHLPLLSPHQLSPSSAKHRNLKFKSEATGLGKTWKWGMKKVTTSATNPLLRAYLSFFNYKWDLQKEVRYSKRPLNFMRLSVSSFAPSYRATQPYLTLLWSLMQLCREEKLELLWSGLATKEAQSTAQQEECSSLQQHNQRQKKQSQSHGLESQGSQSPIGENTYTKGLSRVELCFPITLGWRTKQIIPQGRRLKVTERQSCHFQAYLSCRGHMTDVTQVQSLQVEASSCALGQEHCSLQ